MTGRASSHDSKPVIRGEAQRLDLPGILSAALVPGRKRPLHGGRPDLHSSDAFLLSRAAPVIAVADGPERNPVASSSFLEKFDRALADSGISFRKHPVRESFVAVVDVVNDLLRTIDYHDSTTFSAVIPVADGPRCSAIILHTGDSLIFTIARPTGMALQVSRTSHVLVGRAPALFQTEVVGLDPGDLVVLASDGLTDLARTRGVGPGSLLSAPGGASTCSGVVGRVLELIAATEVRLDDITIACVSADLLLGSGFDQRGARVILT